MTMKKIFKKYLPEFILGGIDGSITTFAIVAGVVGASLSSVVILVLGIANLFADGFSMGISNYFSQKSENDLMKKNSKNPIKASLATFLSFIIVGSVPLLPYFINFIFNLKNKNIFFYSALMTLIAFYFIGYLKGNFTNDSKNKSGFKVLIIGGIAAFISFLVGFLLSSLI